MAIYLDEPLDDEPLFSVIARYLERGPKISRSAVCQQLFASQFSLMATECNKTGRVASETQACWGMSAEQIAERMTNYRYYAAFLSAERAKEVLERIAGKSELFKGGQSSGGLESGIFIDIVRRVSQKISGWGSRCIGGALISCLAS